LKISTDIKTWINHGFRQTWDDTRERRVNVTNALLVRGKWILSCVITCEKHLGHHHTFLYFSIRI
jgi:hypothetical protein